MGTASYFVRRRWFRRYELAQQLQQHRPAAPADDGTVDQQGVQVSAQVQVDIEGHGLPQTAEAVATNPEAILELEPQHVVGPEDTGLGPQLADPPLEADEGAYFGSCSLHKAPSHSPRLALCLRLCQSQSGWFLCERETLVCAGIRTDSAYTVSGPCCHPLVC